MRKIALILTLLILLCAPNLYALEEEQPHIVVPNVVNFLDATDCQFNLYAGMIIRVYYSAGCGQPSNTLIIGYNGGETATGSKNANDLSCSPYTAVDNCTVDTGYLKVGTGFGSGEYFRLCIYENDGATSDLITNGQSDQSAEGDGVAEDKAVTFSTPPSLSSGVTYWQCWHASAGMSAYYENDGGEASWYTTTITGNSYASGCPAQVDFTDPAPTQYYIWRQRAENP